VRQWLGKGTPRGWQWIFSRRTADWAAILDCDPGYCSYGRIQYDRTNEIREHVSRPTPVFVEVPGIGHYLYAPKSGSRTVFLHPSVRPGVVLSQNDLTSLIDNMRTW
jgi:hypothetical protein